MGLWAKSVVIFNSIREHGKQSIRSLADRTGLSKSSVHRHLGFPEEYTKFFRFHWIEWYNTKLLIFLM